ncbi:hypothetical protein SCLAR_v1c04310 [Spiroplasma clarkii]|uniref:Uncharacterized protein n=1 Tax=Spiroplasma clarkii TaxID=2139 RepID=A0A2K8KGF1_9MOLU|nr:hypothetical protein SCLAR_v1c04310 [Spiroplasma clarkii]
MLKIVALFLAFPDNWSSCIIYNTASTMIMIKITSAVK